MKILSAGSIFVFLTLLVGPVAAHNGEYKPPPGRTSGPPGSGTPVPPGTRTPGPKKPTTPKFNGPETTPSPRAIAREESISWEFVWELLRDGEPEPPAPMPDATAKQVRDALTGALADENHEVRMFAAIALARAGEIRVVLRSLAEDGDLLRSFAMLAPGLGRGETSLDDDLRARALQLIAHAVADPEAPDLARVSAALSAGLVGSGGANILLETLGAKPPEPLRRACLFSLGLSGHPGARDLLVAQILPPAAGSDRRDDPALRAVLTYGLSRIRAEGVERDLVKRLRDPEDSVRAAAALSLSDRVLSSPAGRSALVDLARSGRVHPRSAALLSLVLAGDRSASDLAKAALRDPVARGSGLPALAALCLGLLRAAECGPDLVKLAGDSSQDVGLRCAAALAAGLVRARGGADDLADLAKKEKVPEVAGYALIGLALLDPERAAPVGTKLFKTAKRSNARYLIAQALGRTSGEKTVAVLVPALADVYEVNREATRSLFRVDPERAATEVLVRLADMEDPFARRYAVLSLARALDRTWPTLIARALLGSGLDTREPMAGMLLYLESDLLFARWGKR